MHNKTLNNNYSQTPLLEGLQYKDLEGIMKPSIHIDEFSSKMGDDKDIIVVSFFVRNKQAAKDLESWFEKGYDFVLDADRSPGEIKPNRYLVYVEIRRRSSSPRNIQELLSDLSTLTEFDPTEWMMTYEDKEQPWSEEAFAAAVPTTPREYDATHKEVEHGLNEWRVAAGLPTKKIYGKVDPELRYLQDAAGI